MKSASKAATGLKGTSRAALGLSVLGVVVPKYGIVITGLSGLFVIFSSGKRSAYAKTALAINFCNLFLLSPLFIMSMFSPDIFQQPVNFAREIFIAVAVVQLITLIIHLRRERKRRRRRAQREELETLAPLNP